MDRHRQMTALASRPYKQRGLRLAGQQHGDGRGQKHREESAGSAGEDRRCGSVRNHGTPAFLSNLPGMARADKQMRPFTSTAIATRI